MKTLYLDCFAGISGDMFIGALLDLGLDLSALETELRKLPLIGYHLEAEVVNKCSIRAVQFKVKLEGVQGEHLADTEFVEAVPGEEHDHPHEHTHTHPEEHDHFHDHFHPEEHGQPHDHVHTGEHDPSQEHTHIHSEEHGHGGEHTHTHPEDHGDSLDGAHSHSGIHEHPHSEDSDRTHTPARNLSDILALINGSMLSARVKSTASRIFERLAEAEGKVHGQPKEQVHFHEVGGVDAIVDIVGAAVGLDLLGVEQVIASPLHLGSGFVRAAHGLLPVPAPATANLLLGIPTYSTETRGELVTPTGAAIVATIAQDFGPMPALITQAIGYGAGNREREFPNVIRAYLGELVSPSTTGIFTSVGAPAVRAPREPHPEQHEGKTGPHGYHEGATLVIEANIDDMNPQFYEHLSERLLESGALDVVLIPIYMKKGRPGMMLHVLAHPSSIYELLSIIYTESTSIGVRTYQVTKRMLQRESKVVQTPYGPVRVKMSCLGEKVVNISPEYEDCRTLARRLGVPLKDIYAAARACAEIRD